MEMKTKPHKHHARSRSFSGGAIVSFLKNTAASFSTTTTTTSSSSTGSKWSSSFNHRNAFSGPIVSIVPPAARGGSRREHRSGYKTPEPSSPKVSCIGQIKKGKSKKLAKAKAAACCKNGVCPLPPRPPAARQKSSLFRSMLFRRSKSRSGSSRDTSSSGGGGGGGGFFKGRKSTTTTTGRAAVAAAPPAPAGLGQMKRFTSGRAAFEDFDWREAQRRGSDDDDDDEVFVAHSAPLVMGGGVVASEPRKEVNLWSRRPMAPPTPLRLP